MPSTSDQGLIDAAGIANKTTAASAFTANQLTAADMAGYTGGTAAAAARAWLDTVTGDAATLTAAQATVSTITASINAITAGADATAPAIHSATANGSSLVLNYVDATLLDAAHAPANGDFSVLVGGVASSRSRDRPYAMSIPPPRLSPRLTPQAPTKQ